MSRSLNEIVPRLPKDLEPLENTSVTKNIHGTDGGSFYDGKGNRLSTVRNGRKGEPGYSIRCNRAKLRKMMTHNINIKWNKKFVRYEETETSVTAYFEDGTSASGDFLVGADGLHSRGKPFQSMSEPWLMFLVRKQFLQARPVEPLPTPYGIIIGEITLNKEQYKQELENGPAWYIAQWESSHLFVGMKDASPDEEEAYFYWMYFWHDEQASKLGNKYWTQTASREELHQYAQEHVLKDVHPKLSQVVRLSKPENLLYPPLQLHQWVPYQELPKGRVTVLGDAAHPMLPFRGEGANNALLDAVTLGEQVGKAVREDPSNWLAMAKAKYEAEMLPRGAESVIRSGSLGDRSEEGVKKLAEEADERLKKSHQTLGS